MLYEVITQWSKEFGCKYYDMGGITPVVAEALNSGEELPDVKGSGIAHFKLGFGEKHIFPEAYDNTYTFLPRWFVRWVVITSYSIHYTKLYESAAERKASAATATSRTTSRDAGRCRWRPPTAARSAACTSPWRASRPGRACSRPTSNRCAAYAPIRISRETSDCVSLALVENPP